MAFPRDEPTRQGVTRCVELGHVREAKYVEVAGISIVRQCPGSAKGIVFVTIEDETGIAEGILWPDRSRRSAAP